MRITAIWGTPSDMWFAGTESSFCAPPDCTNVTRLVAVRRRTDGSGATTWDAVPMAVEGSTAIAGGAATSSGLQFLVARTKQFDIGLAMRVADDPAKLDPKFGPVTIVGSHAWSFEVAENYGQPHGLWGREANDVWLIGEFGVVRRFDGSSWTVARVARTPRAPLVNDLRGIDAYVGASGEREMWIVGDDVAMHRTVKP
jgi:hypothetical protein